MKNLTNDTSPQRKNVTEKVGLIAVFAALAIGGNYALSAIPNVELSSIMVFLSGFLFGPAIGAFTGLISMTIYQFWNPWGAFIPPIGFTVIACTTFTGIIGGILGQNLQSYKTSDSRWFLWPALFGVMTTLVFDLATNYSYSLSFAVPFLIALLTGLPFLLIHIISNAILFGALTQPVSEAVHQLYYGQKRTNNKD